MDLRVNLKLDGSGFSQGLQRAQGEVAKFGKSAESSLVRQFGGMFTVGALAGIHREALKMASNLHKLALTTDLSVSKLHELGFAAAQSDTELTTVAAAYSKLSKSIADARSGNKEAVDAFKDLGFGIEQLRTMNADAVFKALAEGIKNMGDETEATAALMKIMGKSAAELKPVVLELSENMAKYRAGGVYKPSEKAIETLDYAGDEYSRMWGNTKGVGTSISAALEGLHIGLAGYVDFFLNMAKGAWYNHAKPFIKPVWPFGGEYGSKDISLSETYRDAVARWNWSNRKAQGDYNPFVIKEGDLGNQGTKVVTYRAERTVNLMEEETKAQALLARVEESRFDRQLDSLGVEQQRAEILDKIAKLERQSIEERYQGNELKYAELQMDIEQYRAKLGHLNQAGPKPTGGREFSSDSLTAVGNFLGAGRGAIDSISRETNKILRDSHVTLQDIARSVRRNPQTIEVP